MKKLSIITAVLCSAIILPYCKKQYSEQSRMASITVVDNTKPAMVDFIPEPRSGNKSNLGQADIN